MILVNDRDKVKWKENMTVRDLLKIMNYTYTLITVAVNGKLVQKEDYDSFKIPDNSDINIFHLAHGG